MIENRWKKVFAGYDSSAVENLRQELCAELKKAEKEADNDYDEYRKASQVVKSKGDILLNKALAAEAEGRRSFAKELRESLEGKTK